MAESIEAELEVVTPLFLGGADQSEAEIRGASIRGAMRFWFRALAAQTDPASLRDLESDVFGDTKRASSVLVEVA